MTHNGGMAKRSIEDTSIVRRAMRLLVPALLVAFASPAAGPMAAAHAAAADEDVAASPLGKWTTIDDETGKARSVVHIYEYQGKLRGKIIELLENPDATCDKCEGRLKGRPVLGMIIMWDMERDGDEWSGGNVFDPEKGKTYRAKLWLEDENTLKLRGYAGPFFRTQVWHRSG